MNQDSYCGVLKENYMWHPFEISIKSENQNINFDVDPTFINIKAPV